MSILEAVSAYLESDGWPYVKLEGRPVVKLSYTGDHGTWNCYLVERDEHAQLVVYSVFTEAIPPGRRLEVAEFLTRANYGLMIGNFEMDLDDGDVRYKTSVQFESTDIEPERIRDVLLPNVVVMDRYLPGLRAVAGSGLSAKAALSLVEGPAEDNAAAPS
jgi:hypothetical protein